MSQRVLKTTYHGRPVNVLMGWDRPLSYYFMVIEYADAADELEDPVYSNLDDEHAGLEGELSYFETVARRLGILIPQAMLARLQVDQVVDRGNAHSVFDVSGIELSA
jgi:hypothetical protein